jgi:hypothetical protein
MREDELTKIGRGQMEYPKKTETHGLALDLHGHRVVVVVYSMQENKSLHLESEYLM